MKAAVMAFATLALGGSPPGGNTQGSWPLDARDGKPVLLGETTAGVILAHRAVFREQFAKVTLPVPLKARWKAIRHPFTLVAVFGSWCGDSHYQLPDLLALEAAPNPFVEIHYLGVDHDKRLSPGLWPRGCEPQMVQRVPTFYLFATQPGGGQRLVGSVVENPPRAGQSMAEALVELLERPLQP